LIRIEVDPALSPDQLDALWRSAWGAAAGEYTQRVLPRSLAYLGAFDTDRLVGFVNVGWDGGVHAFVLGTCVHADFQRRGIATMLVRRAAEVAKDRGADWLHVDFEPHLEGFCRACGFRPTAAGLIDLTK
jgi:ribosomal protein S18 acetylase RimI-like enzyme